MTFAQCVAQPEKFRNDKMPEGWWWQVEDGRVVHSSGEDMMLVSIDVSFFQHDEFYIMQPETIEVGDTVRSKLSGNDGKVEYITDSGGCFVNIKGYQVPQIIHMTNLTLINKGPESHVFEGVRIMKGGGIYFPCGMDEVEEDMLAPLHQFNTNGRVIYRLTLTPMEDTNERD